MLRPASNSLLLCLCVQPEMCVCSDVLLCKLPAVLRCVAALLAVEPEEDRASPASSSSLLSADFLLFYCSVMALLYAIYCYLLT